MLVCGILLNPVRFSLGVLREQSVNHVGIVLGLLYTKTGEKSKTNQYLMPTKKLFSGQEMHQLYKAAKH